MPPEQVEGSSSSVTPRSDVYSLGATLYHVIAGRPPFAGLTDLGIIAALLTKDPEPPSKFNRRALGDLDTIALKCLEKDPARRYASAEELAADLDHWLAGDPIVARPLGVLARAGRRVRRQAKTAASIALAVLVAAGAIGYAALKPRLEARHRAAVRQRARTAAGDAARTLASDALSKLAPVERELASAEGAAIEPLIQSAASAVAPIASEEPIRARLAELAASAAQGELGAGELDAVVEESVALLGQRALLARAAHLQATGWRKLGRQGDAAREGARAYRLDPAGESGATASLEIALELLERQDWKSALLVLDSLSSRKLPNPQLAARALLGAGKAALALGDLAPARSRTRRALETGALGDADRAEAELSERSRPDSWRRSRRSCPSRPGSSSPTTKAACRTSSGSRTRSRAAWPLYRYDARRASLLQVATLDIGGRESKGLDVMTVEGQRRLVSIVTHGRDKGLEIYRFDGQSFELERTVPLPALPDCGLRLERVCDLDGDGRPDLVCVASHGKNWPVVILDPLGTPVAQQPFHEDDAGGRFNGGCDLHDPYAVDLDGKGKASLVVGSTRWNGFCLRVLDWPEPHGAFVETGQRVIGTPRGHRVQVLPGAGGREELYVAGDRDPDSEALFDTLEGADSRTPDTVWRVSRAAGERKTTFEPVLARPLADSRAGYLEVRGAGWLGKAWPDTVAVREETWANGPREGHWIFVARSGSRSLALRIGSRKEADPFAPVVLAADLDGDGEPELVGWQPDGLVVRGLKALGDALESPAPAAGAHETSTLDVGLDLLACGEASEAASQLQLVAQDAATTPADRARASLALARAYALLGKHDLARTTCLQLAEREPRLAKDALFRAEDHAEDQHDYASALADLERLDRHEPLSSDEAREVARRRSRVEPFTKLAEVLRIDPRRSLVCPGT